MASFEFKMVDWLASLKRQLLPKPILFDPVRKKWMAETPEETVRQCLIQYLNLKHHIPLSRMAVEKQVAVYQLKKRFDLVVYNKMAARPLKIRLNPLYPLHPRSHPATRGVAEQTLRTNNQQRTDCLLPPDNQ